MNCLFLGRLVFCCGAAIIFAALTFSGNKLLAENPPRRPCAVAVSLDGTQVFTANRDSGTISVIDVQTKTAVDEIRVGGRLGGIVMPCDDCLLIIDSEQHQLVKVVLIESRWTVVERIEVAAYPLSILFDRNNSRCYVSSLWSRVVSAFDFTADSRELKSNSQIVLPFQPHQMCLNSASKQLIVASSFAAQLAVVETLPSLKLVSNGTLSGHNIRGIQITASGELLLTRQVISPLAQTTRDDVHWGNLISNQLVAIPLDAVANSLESLERSCTITQLGQPGNAAGDPCQISFAQSGRIAVLLSGTSEVAIGANSRVTDFRRLPLGSRPVACAAQGEKLFVANMFSDSLSIIDLESKSDPVHISLGQSRELSIAEQGEMLFHNSRLGLDGWMSCFSCHTDGHSNEQLNDNLSDGTLGSPKRVLSLLDVAQTGPWAWNGSVATLEQQIANSVEQTMQGKKISTQQIESLVAYLKTQHNPKANPLNEEQQLLVLKGQKVFAEQACGDCHSPPAFTSTKSYRLVLPDQPNNQAYNPPSLLGARHRSRFFHDSRANSLEEVFEKFQHQVSSQVDEADLQALIAYIRSL